MGKDTKEVGMVRWTEAEDARLKALIERQADPDPAKVVALLARLTGTRRSVGAVYEHIHALWPDKVEGLIRFRLARGEERKRRLEGRTALPTDVEMVPAREVGARFPGARRWLADQARAGRLKRWGADRTFYYALPDVVALLKTRDGGAQAAQEAPGKATPAEGPTGVPAGAGKAQAATGNVRAMESLPVSRNRWTPSEHRTLVRLLREHGTEPSVVQRLLAGYTGSRRTMAALYSQAHSHVSKRVFTNAVREAFLVALKDEREVASATPLQMPAPKVAGPADFVIALPPEGIDRLRQALAMLQHDGEPEVIVSDGARTLKIRRIESPAWRIL